MPALRIAIISDLEAILEAKENNSNKEEEMTKKINKIRDEIDIVSKDYFFYRRLPFKEVIKLF